MVNYILNDTEVPAFPTVDTNTYPHTVVFDISSEKTSDFNFDYELVFVSTPPIYGSFVLNGVSVETVAFESSVSVVGYACLKNAKSWKKISLTAPEGSTAQYLFIEGSSYVWSSVDIVNINTGNVQYKTTEIQQRIFADTPNISTNLDNSKEYTFYQGDYITGFRIDATSSDSSYGGILTYQWYMIENGVDKLITDATSNSYIPDTSKLGTFQYYCIVTNTYDGYIATTTSNIVTVIIKTKESVTSQKAKFDQQSAILGWIVGKMLQYILKLDSEADDAMLINETLHLFDGNSILINNVLEVK